MPTQVKAWHMSLRAKGAALLAVPLASLVAVLLAVYWLEDRSNTLALELARAYEVRSQLTALRIAVEAVVRTPEGEPALRRAGDVQAKLAQSSSGDPRLSVRIQELRRLTAAAIESKSTDRLDVAVAQVREYLDARFQSARAQLAEAQRSLLSTLLLCGVLGTLGTLLVHLMITGRLVNRLRVVGESARQLAHGAPLGPAPPGSDEIADLGREVANAARLLGERERELRESEQRYRDLFDQAPVPYEETDAKGTIRRVNQAVCGMLHVRPAQLIGRPAWEMVSGGDQEQVRDSMLRRIAAAEEAAPFECEYQLPDGTYLTVEVREKLIHNPWGEISGTVRSLLDVTERNLADIAAKKVSQYAMELRIRNEQLARALDAAQAATVAKSRFLANVSHELRTPLNGIIGFSELLHDGKIGPLADEQRDVLADILNSARHLLRLINDVLDLSKVEAGRMEFYPEPQSIGDLVAEVRDVIRPLAEKKQLELNVDIPQEIHAVLDGSRFKQVVYNYLSNAVKFTAEGGAVSVRVLPEGEDQFRLEVEDTGIGIEEQEIPRLFQEFGQLGNRRRAEQGTGLGLALTRHLVEAQGGRVGVMSNPSMGSIFFAILPVEMKQRITNASE